MKVSPGAQGLGPGKAMSQGRVSTGEGWLHVTEGCCPRQGGGGGGGLAVWPPPGGEPGRPGVFAPQSLGWRGEPGSVSGRCWVWAASSLGFEAWVGPQRPHVLREALGPPRRWGGGWCGSRSRRRPRNAAGSAPSCNAVFIVGGLAVPQPLPADRKLGIRGLAPAERGGRDRSLLPVHPLSAKVPA